MPLQLYYFVNLLVSIYGMIIYGYPIVVFLGRYFEVREGDKSIILWATTRMDLSLHHPCGVQVWVRAHILQNLMNSVRHLLERQVPVGLVHFGER
jgi:hypothetical protein